MCSENVLALGFMYAMKGENVVLLLGSIALSKCIYIVCIIYFPGGKMYAYYVSGVKVFSIQVINYLRPVTTDAEGTKTSARAI